MAVDLKEFVRQHEAEICTFCFYMLKDEQSYSNMVYLIFETFTKKFIKSLRMLDYEELRLELFREAIEKLDAFYHTQITPRSLLTKPINKISNSKNLYHEGLLLINVNLRTILVLRDILGIQDEQTMKILSLRWGVYRHRLNRARVEFIQTMQRLKKEHMVYENER